MPIVFAAIAPHGFPIIPLLSDDADGALDTRAAMEEMGRRAAAAGLEAIVVAGPHGMRVDGAVALGDVGRGAGTLTWRGQTVEMNVPVDGPLTDAVAIAAGERDVPIAMVGYGGSRRWQSVMPLDWGSMTPLWFLGHDRHLPERGNVLADPPESDLGPPVVIVTPSRALPRETLIEFGQAVASAAATDGRRIGFVASCDWAHTHAADGPYGAHEAAARVDARVVDAVRSENLADLRDVSDQDATDAAIDGLWQTLILDGVLQETGLRVDLLSYEAPTYYGMLVAVYQ